MIKLAKKFSRRQRWLNHSAKRNLRGRSAATEQLVSHMHSERVPAQVEPGYPVEACT